MQQISVVRGTNLNKFEMQNYEPLIDRFQITGYTTKNSAHDIDNITFPVKHLPAIESYTAKLPDPVVKPIDILKNRFGFIQYMYGLERELEEADIAHTAEIHNAYSYQAIKAKRRNPSLKVACTIWRNVPFVKWKIPIIGHVPRTTRSKRKEVIINSDVFLPVTEKSKETLLTEGIPAEKIEIVRPGIDLSRFQPRNQVSLDTELEGFESRLTFLFVGRLVWEKGVTTLVKSFKRLVEVNKLDEDIHLILIGEGPEKNEVLSLIHRHGLSDSCTLVSSVPYGEIHKYYNMSDIFVLPSSVRPSWQEQYGMVLIEAMASGLPIITTRSGSIPWVVGDAAELVQASDFLSLYQAMKQLAMNEQRRTELGHQARQRAENRYDRTETAEKIEKLYDRLLS